MTKLCEVDSSEAVTPRQRAMKAAALAACGGDLGRERLAAYSKDARAIYRNMARRLLAKYAG